MSTDQTIRSAGIAEASGRSESRWAPSRWVRSPRALAVGGIALAGASLALGWDWLAAVGALPVLLSLLPCAAMCALGLCMGKGRESCNKPPADQASKDDIDPTVRPSESH